MSGRTTISKTNASGAQMWLQKEMSRGNVDKILRDWRRIVNSISLHVIKLFAAAQLVFETAYIHTMESRSTERNGELV